MLTKGAVKMVRMVKLGGTDFSVYDIAGLKDIRLIHQGMTRDNYTAYDTFNECQIEIIRQNDGRVFLERNEESEQIFNKNRD
jgi:hypothetical protein